MKLDSITLQNFKGIDNLEIKLDNKTTVIFGVNGVGKSTILQAIDLLYADIIAQLMGTVRSKTARFNEDFISYGKSAAGIKADFNFGDGESIYYERTIDRAKGEKRNTSALKKLTDKFQSLYIQMGYDDDWKCREYFLQTSLHDPDVFFPSDVLRYVCHRNELHPFLYIQNPFP